MDLLIELQESYYKVRKYLEEDSKNDPETEPYKSKYRAREYLKSMRELLLTALEKEPGDAKIKGMLSVVTLQMGVISIDTEELSNGETFLNAAVELVPETEDPKYILVALNARNLLGILWSDRGDIEKAQTWLEECEELYNNFITKSNADEAFNLHDHFSMSVDLPASSGIEEVEKVHTLTKFYLAQVYGKLGNSMKSAIYCHETLRRQLESKKYDPIDWALNSATLSQFFMERRHFRQALHHLAAASYIMDKYEDALQVQELSEEECEAKKEDLRHRRADVSRCWAKYGIYILEQSKNAVTGEGDDIFEVSYSQPLLQDLWFSTLELSEYEAQMTDKLVVDFEAARDLMLITQKHIILAKEYYTLEDHASDYVQIVQDHSTTLRHLSGFEKDSGRLCKMLKKRINMMEDVLKEINPQYYLDMCRSLWFEVGEAYHDLMQQKQDRIKGNEGLPDPGALAKANTLAEKSIVNFQKFLDSVKNKQTNKLPEKLPSDLLRPVLVAHFYLGRLYYKLLTPDKRQVLQNIHESLQCFKYVSEYCAEDRAAATIISEELSVSEEMMSLLQLKMKHMLNTLA